MSKTYITFKGVDLDYSNHEFVSWPFHHHLFDESIELGANVTFTSPARNAITYPAGSAGECLNLVYVYPNFFSSESLIDGAIEGQVIARMYSAGAGTGYVMYITNILITLFKYKADGTIEDIVAETSVWSGSVSLAAVTGSSLTKDVPVFFSFDCEDIMTTDAILALKVRVLGYLSAANPNMYFQLLCGPTEADLKISIPFVEEDS